jgi:hypothetical protein
MQHDFVVDNAFHLPVRLSINEALQALATQSSGPTAPATPYAFQYWRQTPEGILWQRNAANSAWVAVDSAGGVRADLAAQTGTTLIGHLPTGAASSVVLQAYLRARQADVINMADAPYNLLVDGSDQTANVLAAIAAAKIAKKPIYIPHGVTGVIALSGAVGLDIDLGLMSIHGDNVKFDCSALTATYAIRIYSSASYEDKGSNNTNAVTGLRFRGNSTIGRHGLIYGKAGAGFEHTSEISFRGASIEFFDHNLTYDENAWRVSTSEALFKAPLSKMIYFASTLGGNAGENLLYSHCQFDGNSGAPIDLRGGQHIFDDGCSFLNTPIEEDGLCYAHFSAPNFENPGGTAVYRMLHVKGADSRAVILGGAITLNNPGTTINVPPFRSDSTGAGILAIGMLYPPKSAFFIPELASTNGQAVICDGAGRSEAISCKTFSNFVGNNNLPFSLNGNLLYNGSWESGTFDGWTKTDYGVGASTAIATVGSKRSGFFGLDVTCPAGGGTVIKQAGIPFRPNKQIFLKSWVNVLAGNVTINIDFISASGAVISTLNPGAITATPYADYGPTVVSPQGTVKIDVYMVMSIAGHAYFDDFNSLEG